MAASTHGAIFEPGPGTRRHRSSAQLSPATDYLSLQNLLAVAYLWDQDRRSAKQKLNQTTQHFSAVLEGLRRISNSQSALSDILPFVAEQAKDLTGATGAVIALAEEDEIRCVARAGSMAPRLGARVSLEAGLSGECIRTGATVLCLDAATDARVDAVACRTLNVRSAIAAPLSLPDGVAGLVEILSDQPAAFGDREVAIVEVLAALVVRAICMQAMPAEPAVPEAAATDPNGPTSAASEAMVVTETAPRPSEIARVEADSAPMVDVTIGARDPELSLASRRQLLLAVVVVAILAGLFWGGTVLRVHLRARAQASIPTGGAVETPSPASQPEAGTEVLPVEPGIGTISAVNYSSKREFTAIEVRLDRRATAIHAVRLRNPDRVYFDLSGIHLTSSVSKTIEVNDKRVVRIRLAQTTPQLVRMVIDLTCACDYAFVTSQRAPYRLAISIDSPGENQGAAKGDPGATVKLSPIALMEVAPGGAAGNLSGHRLRIAIDPGHGGQELGAVGPGGTKEKDVVLDIAQRLGALLTARQGAEIVYTRTDDRSVPLETRAAIANQAQADLFISIHGNSSPSAGARGVETYYFERADTGAELRAAGIRGISDSRLLAASVQRVLYATVAANSEEQQNRGVKTANFLLLMRLGMPAALTEVAFLNSLADERNLTHPEMRDKVADAICRGILSYLDAKASRRAKLTNVSARPR